MIQSSSIHHSIFHKLHHWKRNAARGAVLCLVAATVATTGRSQDVTFTKSRYSSVNSSRETEVILTLTDSKVALANRKDNKKDKKIDVEIPYSSIDGLSYEVAARHRVGEGATLMLLSLGAGAVLMGTKTKSHWLDIEYHEGEVKQLAVLRLDKSEYENVISTLEARTGKKVAVLEANKSQFNPTAGSKDMDEMVPFGVEAVAAALKPAMENFGCNVTETKANRVECKRPWGNSRATERTGSGGEKIVARLDAKGERTRVRIATEKGFRGKMVKKNWSTPIYQEMLKSLEHPTQSTKVSGTN